MVSRPSVVTVSGHFGTGAEVSKGHFGIGAEMSWHRSVPVPKCP